MSNSLENKKIVKDYIEKIINTGDTQTISDFIAVDYKEIYNGKIFEIGIEGAKKHVNGVHETYANLNLKIENQWCENEYVITQYRMTGLHVGTWMDIKPTNKSVEIHGVNIDKVVNGKITEHGGSANLLEPLLSIGGVSINKD